ncbi:hypothetical protein [Pantoea sp. ACRSB]|uniref:hypothetical protein n=1 Tax=Pantoea sp. ACRSB TaxID=2918207 RepID=UPI0028935DB6|nr:hypothetical protein [Pantoea sp. ACRSB]MCG7388747.1 hypothetical protein [Pantoea sp. ACRSB]
MDVQAYRVAVRLALDDQITRNMMQVSRDAIELNKKFVEMAKNIKAVTSAAKEASAAIRSLNNSLSNQFSGAVRGAGEYVNAMRSAADHAVRASNATRNLPALAGGYGAAIALPALAAGAATSRGGGGAGYGSTGGMLALPSPSGSGKSWNGWNDGVPPGGWGGGSSGGGNDGASGGRSGSDGGRRGSHSDGMTNLATGYFGFKMLDGFVDEAAKYQTMTEKFNQYGMGEAARKDAESFAQTTKILGTSTTDMLKYFTEAQGVFRESGASTLDEQLRAAKMAAPVLARINFASQGLDEHAKEMTTAKQMDMLRFVETAGGLKSPQRFNELMDAGFKAIQSSGGNVDFTQYRQFMAKAGTSAFNLSNKALFAELEPIIGELKGSSAGDALMTSYNRLNGIVKLPNQVTHDLMKMGVWDARKIELNNMGGVKRFLGNPLINSQLFSQSPVEYYEKMILPIYRKNNYTEDQIQRENALIFGRTGGKMFNLIDKQLTTIHHSVESYGMARDLNNAYGAVGSTYNGKVVDFQKKWENLQLVMGKDGGLLDTFTKGLDSLTTTMQRMTEIAHKNPELAKFVGQAALAVTGLAAVSGGFWIIKHAAGALYSPLKLAGWGIDLLIGRSATTGLTGLAGALGGLPALIGAVIAAALYPTSTASQSQENAEKARWGEMNSADHGVAYKPWSPSQADFDNQRAREQTYRKTGKYPSIPPVQNNSSSQPVNLMMTHEGRQVLVATVVNGMGKQANKAPSSTSAFDSSMLMTYPGQVSKLSTQQ